MKKTLIALTILASALSGAQAGIILSDDFTYNDGPIAQPTAATINPSSTWLANSGATDLDVTNNTLIVTSQRAQDGYHTLTGYPYLTNGPTTALYSRFTLKCTFLPTAPAGTYFASFGGTNQYASGGANVSGFRARLWASQTNYLDGSGVGVGQFRLGIVNSGYDVNNVSLVNTNYVWPTPLLTNTTYTIVTKYVLATGVSTLWVNPSAESDPSVTDPTVLPPEPTSAPPVNGIINISGYCFRQATGEGTLLIDDLRVGTLFSDIAGANTSPTINVPVNQNTPRNTAIGPLAVTVQDGETPASELIVTVSSSNTGLVPNGNISLASLAGGTNRTITITPVTGQQGFTTITLVVNDSVNYTTNSFVLTVGAPTIGAIPNQITSLNTATPAIPFAVGDTEGDTLTLTKSSSNPTLVPTSNIQFGVAVPNVSSNVVVTPAAGQNGVALITISVSDGYNTSSTTVRVTVTPAPLGLVYNEDFAYTGFDLPTSQGLYNATGGSGAPWHHVSGTTSYELQVTNPWAYIVGTNNEDLGADFIGPTAYDGSQGYVFYTSFTVDFSYLPSAGGDYFFHLSASGTDASAFHDKIFANKANAATGKFRLGIANTATSPLQFARDLMLHGTYAVVTRYNAATGDSTLWVNPNNEQSPSVTASDSPASSTIGGVALRQAGCCTGDLAIGPMKVGTSFFDVWTAPAQPPLHWMVDNSGNLVMSWTNPLFVLQNAPDAAGPYTDLAATSSYTNSISGQQYFRLRY